MPNSIGIEGDLTEGNMEILAQISNSLQEGDEGKVFELTRQAIAAKLSPKRILDEGLLAGMKVLGEKFGRHEIFLPDVLLGARAMSIAMDQIKPLLIDEHIPTMGKVVLGTVQGDLHDIGKNLVGIMLKGAGLEVIDLGKGVSPEKFVEAALSEKADVLGMSALLTTTMPVMKQVIELLEQRQLKETIRTIIGGAPVSQEYANKIGADAYAYDAANAVVCVKRLLGLP